MFIALTYWYNFFPEEDKIALGLPEWAAMTEDFKYWFTDPTQIIKIRFAIM